MPTPDTCSVLTDGVLYDGTVAYMKIGDSFWWQAGQCMWTPSENRLNGGECDIKMKKIGYSH